jgi:polyisoprenoid-binding protein YceI
MKFANLMVVSLAAAGAASAAPVTYTVDPDHTHPSFEVDHLGGLSIWRGTFKRTSGSIVIDTAASSGSVDIVIDPASIDLAQDKLSEHVASPEMLDTKRYPTATYKGKVIFRAGTPASIEGDLTLHGVTRPVKLKIESFKCIQHPMTKKEVCGADATGQFNRADFGVDYGQKFGFKQDVTMRIQVEAIKTG